ncbi:unnamed protein product [Didymodactylos carnosus]|uniref:Uncharacterized protein n=1 Tax=Didymodactylos carnosus TaxID=1234261 RepID=A0A813SAT3_9BILA|nr:unnamed protein product [Didymodactylos carnosus]CAF1433691.1 unnamed protein product [Didymodactylos carnosus]CAF3576757.1 unnamed protein product [Didymodactylos carnosus]CAF4231406.1 unnamed protein product [Didymodactylos carnosus]
MSDSRLSMNNKELFPRQLGRKHTNIFIGIGIAITLGILSFITLKNHTYNRRHVMAKIRRDIQEIPAGTESMFESYQKKLQQRQLAQSTHDKNDL